MMDWGNGGWSAGDWIAMSTMMIVFWGALIALAVWVVRLVRGERAASGEGASRPFKPDVE